MLYFCQPVLGASNQDDMAVIEKSRQGFTQIHDARRGAGIQNVHVKGEPGFQLGLAEQLFHQHSGVCGAAFGFQHDADGV